MAVISDKENYYERIKTELANRPFGKIWQNVLSKLKGRVKSIL